MAGQECGIYARTLLRIDHGKNCYFVPIVDTKSGALRLGIFTDEHVIGGLPKPNYFSIACGSLTTLPATY
jgi:hypothetical protein